jgi:hypothetical protein
VRCHLAPLPRPLTHRETKLSRRLSGTPLPLPVPASALACCRCIWLSRCLHLLARICACLLLVVVTACAYRHAHMLLRALLGLSFESSCCCGCCCAVHVFTDTNRRGYWTSAVVGSAPASYVACAGLSTSRRDWQTAAVVGLPFCVIPIPIRDLARFLPGGGKCRRGAR